MVFGGKRGRRKQGLEFYKPLDLRGQQQRTVSKWDYARNVRAKLRNFFLEPLVGRGKGHEAVSNFVIF